MARRLLKIALIVGLACGLAVFVAASWLAGRPLAPRSAATSSPLPDAFGSDLLTPPSSTGSPAPQPQGFPADPAPPRHIRTIKQQTPPFERTVNCLLVGLDRRPGAGRGGRSDTIVVAVLDRRSDHVGLISIPRDLYVEFPGHGPARINAAYGIGRQTGQDGLLLLERVVEDTLAIPIHHALAVDLSLFERTVDSLGGVAVHVPCPIRDNFIDPREPSGRRLLDVPAGLQLMGGATAAMYVRSRHGRSDWDRARRQQAVLVAMRERLLTAGGLTRLPALLEQVVESVETEMTRLDMLRLAQRALATGPEELHGLVVGYRQTEQWTTPEGRWVLIPRFEAIDEALEGLFSAPAPGLRPQGARCPDADVAITRPGRSAARRVARGDGGAGGGHSLSDEDTASNSSQSPSSPSAPPSP